MGILSEEPWLGRFCTSPLVCAQYLHLWTPESTKNAKQRHLVDPYIEEAMWKGQSTVRKNQSKVKMEMSIPEAHVRATLFLAKNVNWLKKKNPVFSSLKLGIIILVQTASCAALSLEIL